MPSKTELKIGKDNKNKTTLLRLSQYEDNLISNKANILGLDKSKLLRNAAFTYWNGSGLQEDDLLKRWQNGDENTKKLIVDLVFEHYRRTGYPHNTLTEDQLTKQMCSLVKTSNVLLSENRLQMNTFGLAIPNSFHPHMMKVKCRKNNLSPWELYQDDEKFKDAINRWMELNRKPTASGLRRILRTRDGVRSVVNFKPSIARYFYENYCVAGGRVLDPCAGFGGRLCGLISCSKGLIYHGIDPCGETAVGNVKMASFYSKQHDLMGRKWKFGFRFDLGCAEEILPEIASESYDLVFTSPPYFDVEKYEENNPMQSYIKFKTYNEWRDGFLKVVLKESVRVLKSGGYFVWNVKNCEGNLIADDSLEIMKNIDGVELVKTYKMMLANSEYHRKKDKKIERYEPVFVFRKN